MNDDLLEELASATPEFEEILNERRELNLALEHWRASGSDEAPYRVAEFTLLLAELEEEIRKIRSKHESFQPAMQSKSEE